MAVTIFPVLYSVTTVEILFLLFCEQHCMHFVIFFYFLAVAVVLPPDERGGEWGKGAIEEEGAYSVSQ